MISRPRRWWRDVREAIVAVLAIALLLQGILPARAALRGPVLDPAAFLCSEHPGPGPASGPDAGHEAPTDRAFCCTLLCGAGGGPLGALPPGPWLAPPAAAWRVDASAPTFHMGLRPVRLRNAHHARAPPLRA